MRVVFLEDVAGVAQGGEIKEVKNGFARNYLIPKRLAVLATQDSLQRVERLKHRAEDTRLQKLTDMKALGEELKRGPGEHRDEGRGQRPAYTAPLPTPT